MREDEVHFRCPGLTDGGTFPLDNTGRGRDISPEIILEDLSPRARSLALTLEDLSHPIRGFTHWVAWDLPAQARIPEGLPRGARLPGGGFQGVAYGFHRYAGPKPPPFARHRYRLTVYVLDGFLALPPSSRKRQVLKAAAGHVLQKGALTAEFG